ncbi:class I SAM-dependent methyltransferase [Streptomyces sp. 4N509B]|uniref:class I SAM-dependent methyltransferase n=1 Tax=Streptomyces sp. 4N509B TaxID=3457413 RepID=UPI003FD2AD96
MTKPESQPWMPDELDHAGPEHLDPDFVAAFDRKQGHPDPTEDIEAFRAHGIGPDATVIDLGAGTGQFAVPAARAFAHVIAVDVSPAMLDALRARAAEAGVSNITVVQAGFLTFPHPPRPADAVHTRHALHQLPDVWKAVALDRIAHTLRPGGVLRLRDLVYDIHPSEAPALFTEWLTAAPADPAHGYTADDLATHIRTEHSTYRWLLESMLTTTGFDITEVSYVGRAFGAYTGVRR